MKNVKIVNDKIEVENFCYGIADHCSYDSYEDFIDYLDNLDYDDITDDDGEYLWISVLEGDNVLTVTIDENNGVDEFEKMLMEKYPQFEEYEIRYMVQELIKEMQSELYNDLCKRFDERAKYIRSEHEDDE